MRDRRNVKQSKDPAPSKSDHDPIPSKGRDGVSRKQAAQLQLESLENEAKRLFLLHGLSSSEIKKTLKAENKTIDEDKIATIVDNMVSTFEKGGQLDGNRNRYLIHDGRVFAIKGYGEKVHSKKLTNFYLTSIRPIVRDNGLDKDHSFEIEATLGEHTVPEELLADDFQRMRWPLNVLGPDALVTPRMEPEAAYGLQVTARKLPKKVIFTHVGWRTIGGKAYYLHADGAIGADGNRKDIRATLPGKLRYFSLPDPPTGEELRKVVLASLGLLGVASDSISLPLFSAIYRAPLENSAMTVYSSGGTGLRKTAVNLVAQQHYGKDFDEKGIHHWDSTSNFLKEDLFSTKDCTALVDDFVPNGSIREITKAYATADDLIRSVANQSGRGRLSKDGRPQIPHEPRGLMLATGETRPSGHSLAARTVHLSFTKNSVDNERLTQCQTDARAGLYAQAMAAYLQYIARRYGLVRDQIKVRTDELRALLTTEGRLLRSANNLASLAVGFEVFLSFAIVARAIDSAEADELWHRVWSTFLKLAAAQDDVQQSEDPAKEVLRLLYSAALNEKIFLEDLDPGELNSPSANALRVGWKESADDGSGEVWYCEPEALHAAIVRLYRDQNSALPWAKEILWQRLAERGYTRQHGDRDHYFRKSILGKQLRIIYIPPETWTKINAEAESESKDRSATTPPRRAW
jgi:hypothetical protein